jgi:hypothetical protein
MSAINSVNGFNKERGDKYCNTELMTFSRTLSHVRSFKSALERFI